LLVRDVAPVGEDRSEERRTREREHRPATANKQTVSRARADERASDAEEKRERWDKLYLEMGLAGATSAPVSVDSGWEVAR